MILYIQNSDVRGIEKEFKRLVKPGREYSAELKETKRSRNRRKPEIKSIFTAQDARELGYIRGVKVEVNGTFRVITSGRIKEQGGNLIVLNGSPFFIFYKGDWVAKILKKI